MSVSGESGLIAGCLRGDAAAWDDLFDRHYAAAGRFVAQLGHDLSREDVEEICQEVFLTVIKHLSSFQGQSQFQTWLFRIAANKTRDYRQRQNAAKRGGGQTPVPLHAPDSSDDSRAVDPPHPGPSPDLALIQAEKAVAVGQALDELGEPCRGIIELRYFADLSYEEIAQTLALNPKTVSSRLSKCLDKLEGVARGMLRREKNPSFPV